MQLRLVRGALLLGVAIQETLEKIRLFIRSLQWVEEAAEVSTRTDWLAVVEAVLVHTAVEAPARSVKET
jgi:hypothetical protein